MTKRSSGFIKTKDDIQFSHERVRKFAEAQLKNYGQDFEVELSNGLYAGARHHTTTTSPLCTMCVACLVVGTSSERDWGHRFTCRPRHDGVAIYCAALGTFDDVAVVV